MHLKSKISTYVYGYLSVYTRRIIYAQTQLKGVWNFNFFPVKMTRKWSTVTPWTYLSLSTKHKKNATAPLIHRSSTITSFPQPFKVLMGNNRLSKRNYLLIIKKKNFFSTEEEYYSTLLAKALIRTSGTLLPSLTSWSVNHTRKHWSSGKKTFSAHAGVNCHLSRFN